MIFHDVIQGTTAWLALRGGIPTASAFENIITPGGEPTKGERRQRYMHTLLAERMMGRPVTEYVSTWMDRGSTSEAEAVAYYEAQRDVDTFKIGFVTNDERTIGASPDRGVGDDGLLEIKVPKEHTHVFYLLKRSAERTYYPQVQGQLWVTARAWVDTLSYHPEMPPALVRVERDVDYIAKLAAAVTKFAGELEAEARELEARGWIRRPLTPPTAEQLRAVEYSASTEPDPEGLF